MNALKYCYCRLPRLFFFSLALLAVFVSSASGDEIFSDDFESGTILAWSTSTISGVSHVTPNEGALGAEILIEGSGFNDPWVELASADINVPLEVISHDSRTILARLDAPLPAGIYDLRIDQGEPLASPLIEDAFAVRSPQDLSVAQTFGAVGDEVTLGGTFLGVEAGMVSLRPRVQPSSTPVAAPILEWLGGSDDSPGEIRFLLPFELTANGLHDVIVENGSGSATLPSALTVTGVADGDIEGPRVAAAVATSNTEVYLQFSEAVIGGLLGAENPAFYRIVAPLEVPTLVVLDAELIVPSLSSVRLLTLGQTDIEYTVSVAGIRDLAGNAIPAPTLLDPTPHSADFFGLPPNGPDLVDSDGDGLLDRDEQLGWFVTVRLANETTHTRHVTSNPGDPRLPTDDPFNIAARDTDGDGLEDLAEKQAILDPRDPDTDADALGDDLEFNVIYSDPADQDTDLDGAEDGFEFLTLLTSPILDDTDGDQLLDFDEVIAGNRNPLVADLPAPLIRVGSVNLELDTRFEFTDEMGQSSSEAKQSTVDLVRSEDVTFATSDQRSTLETLENTASISAEIGVSLPPSATINAGFSSTQGSEQGSTFTVDETTGRQSEQSYEDSLTLESAFDLRETVTRSVEGASVKVDVTIESAGDIPFTISNLELTAQTQNPSNRRQLLSVASLVPENPDLDQINIGALGDPARGPFVFTAVSVFPQQVEELMKSPRGLLVSLANFDITDEAGRNFSFISQDVLDRTAGLSFDLGDGRVETYRVATASVHDRITGEPAGISMRYALERILGLFGEPTIRDGGDGFVDTSAIGDDVQLVARGETIEPGRAVISAGPNGSIESVGSGDDVETAADYATTDPTATAILDGGDGLVDTLALGDDIQLFPLGDTVEPGATILTAGPDGVLDSVPVGDDRLPPGGGAILSRFRDVESGLSDDPATEIDETRRFWALYAAEDLPPNVDFEDLVLRAGDELNFAFVQDLDGDGVMAREEFLHQSSDLLVNTDGCPLGDPCDLTPIAARRQAPEYDVLDDAEEIQEGWRVRLKGSPQSLPVFPNPVQGDSDRDFLSDDEERACRLDPRRRDSDFDGLTDWEELTGQRVINGEVLQMVSRDPDTDQIVFTILPYAGDGEGALIAHESFPDCDALAGIQGFATDPLNPDTDGDQVSDFAELQFGIHPNNPFDGGDFIDDDLDGVSNNREQTGIAVGVDCGADAPPECIMTLTSDPNNEDTDNDTLPDLLEFFIGSSSLSPDTDGDGLADNDEYRGQGEACLTQVPGQPCVLFSSLVENDFLAFVAQCEAAENCQYDEATLLAGRQQYGTNLNESDTDFDGVDDNIELADLILSVDGAQQIIPAPSSDPFLVDTDGEGLDDLAERAAGSNPRSADTDGDLIEDDVEVAQGTDPTLTDTDGDGVDDFREAELGTDPRVQDRLVTLRVNSFIVTFCDDFELFNDCEVNGDWFFEPPSGPTEQFLDLVLTESLPGFETDDNMLPEVFERTFVLPAGSSFRLYSENTFEWDEFSNDPIEAIDCAFSLTCDGSGCTLIPNGVEQTKVQGDAEGNDVVFDINYIIELGMP